MQARFEESVHNLFSRGGDIGWLLSAKADAEEELRKAVKSNLQERQAQLWVESAQKKPKRPLKVPFVVEIVDEEADHGGFDCGNDDVESDVEPPSAKRAKTQSELSILPAPAASAYSPATATAAPAVPAVALQQPILPVHAALPVSRNTVFPAAAPSAPAVSAMSTQPVSRDPVLPSNSAPAGSQQPFFQGIAVPVGLEQRVLAGTAALELGYPISEFPEAAASTLGAHPSAPWPQFNPSFFSTQLSTALLPVFEKSASAQTALLTQVAVDQAKLMSLNLDSVKASQEELLNARMREFEAKEKEKKAKKYKEKAAQKQLAMAAKNAKKLAKELAAAEKERAAASAYAEMASRTAALEADQRFGQIVATQAVTARNQTTLMENQRQEMSLMRDTLMEMRADGTRRAEADARRDSNLELLRDSLVQTNQSLRLVVDTNRQRERVYALFEGFWG